MNNNIFEREKEGKMGGGLEKSIEGTFSQPSNLKKIVGRAGFLSKVG